MRTDRALIVPVVLTLAVGLAILLGGSERRVGYADGDAPAGHGVKTEAPLLEGVVDEERLQWLYENVICSCEKENWTRTLAGCPDGCAVPQKIEVQRGLKAGLSNEQILEQQVEKYGPKVRADPGMSGAGAGAYFLPVIALFIFAWIAGGAVRRWAVDGRSAREERRSRNEDVSPEEVARIERDLSSLE